MLPPIGLGTGGGSFQGASGTGPQDQELSFGDQYGGAENYRFGSGDFVLNRGLQSTDLAIIGGTVLLLGAVVVFFATR